MKLRLSIACCSLVILCVAALIERSCFAETRPNILFILADDMAWTSPSCYGGKNVETPNIDRLSKHGMRFTAGYADAQCSPTRAAFFSGQYGARSKGFKVIHEKEPPNAPMIPPEANLALQPDVASLAITMRQAGYATGISGKWHIADNYSAAALRGKENGKYFDRYGFDFCGPSREDEFPEDKAVTKITDDILGFIDNNKDRPWFACAMHFTTHTKLAAPKALVEKHVARGYKRSSTANGIAPERPTAEMLAMMEHLDNELGRMFKQLDDWKQTENTLIVFTADNGGLTRVQSCEPLREGKGSPYEGGVRVPLIASWPARIQPGSICDTPAHTVDFYPTFVDLAKAQPPTGAVLDGASLVPLLTQTKAFPDRALYWHMPTYTTNYGRTPCSIVQQGGWKLIHWFGDYLDTNGFTPGDQPYGKLILGPRTELYHLSRDLSETTDLAAKHPEKVAEMKQRLESWWKDTQAPLPIANPKFDQDIWWHLPVEPARASRAKAKEKTK